MNTAARMQTHGKEMHCHIGSSTASLLVADQGFHLARRGELAVKGKGMMQTFFLYRSAALAEPTETLKTHCGSRACGSPNLQLLSS